MLIRYEASSIEGYTICPLTISPFENCTGGQVYFLELNDDRHYYYGDKCAGGFEYSRCHKFSNLRFECVPGYGAHLLWDEVELAIACNQSTVNYTTPSRNLTLLGDPDLEYGAAVGFANAKLNCSVDT